MVDYWVQLNSRTDAQGNAAPVEYSKVQVLLALAYVGSPRVRSIRRSGTSQISATST